MISKEDLILSILATIVVLMFIVGAVAIRNMLEDYECNNTPINEINVKKCEKYLKNR